MNKRRNRCCSLHISSSARQYQGRKTHSLKAERKQSLKVFHWTPNMSNFSKILFPISLHALDLSRLSVSSYITPCRTWPSLNNKFLYSVFRPTLRQNTQNRWANMSKQNHAGLHCSRFYAFLSMGSSIITLGTRTVLQSHALYHGVSLQQWGKCLTGEDDSEVSRQISSQ